eukprot:6209061-Pleurochrysis_carterae.AAC.1
MTAAAVERPQRASKRLPATACAWTARSAPREAREVEADEADVDAKPAAHLHARATVSTRTLCRMHAQQRARTAVAAAEREGLQRLRHLPLVDWPIVSPDVPLQMHASITPMATIGCKLQDSIWAEYCHWRTAL